MNLTPEYPPEVKPVRVGVYMTRIDGWGLSGEGYAFWDGQCWSDTCSSVASASHETEKGLPNKHWQGLAEDPGKRADSVADRLADALQVLVGNGGIGSENMFRNARAALAEHNALKETTS